jgi:NTP pyrophosphatase (non-canonical NTP hydrolase)
MQELYEKIRAFNEERDWDQFHSLDNLAKSISIEAGELLECFQWGIDYEHDAVCEELADVLNYCILMADACGLDMDEIICEKIDKNSEKYPVEKAFGCKEKYTEL